jgi:hypothetical protein
VPARQRLMLRYEISIGETAEALILAYGRYAELRCRLGGDPQTGAHVERFSSDGREVVLLGFRHAGAASDFQRFWARYARLYGGGRLRDSASDLPTPVPALHGDPVAVTGKIVARGKARWGLFGGAVLRWRPSVHPWPDLRQALNEMESAGVRVRAVELSPDGTIRLFTASRRDDP